MTKTVSHPRLHPSLGERVSVAPGRMHPEVVRPAVALPAVALVHFLLIVMEDPVRVLQKIEKAAISRVVSCEDALFVLVYCLFLELVLSNNHNFHSARQSYGWVLERLDTVEQLQRLLWLREEVPQPNLCLPFRLPWKIV